MNSRSHKTYTLVGLLAGVFGIIMGGVAIVLMVEDHPAIASITAVLILSIFGWLAFYLPRTRRYAHIKSGIRCIRSSLRKQNLSPDLIVAFNRTGSALAGMLAVNLRIQEVISICKIRTEETTPEIRGKFSYTLTSIVEVNQNELRGRKILVVFYVIDTARSLEQGLSYLSERGVDPNDICVVTMFITPGARHRYPNVIYVYEYDTARACLSDLPWIIDEYDYL